MSCCTTNPDIFFVAPGSGGFTCFSFPSKVAWRTTTYVFELAHWLVGNDTVLSAYASIEPDDVVVTDTVITPTSVSITLEDGVPFVEHRLFCSVVTNNGVTADFTALVYVISGSAVTSPFLTTERGYPITDEFGRLLYWPLHGPLPIVWSADFSNPANSGAYAYLA